MGKDKNNDNYHDEDINLYDLLLTLKRKWLIILIVTSVSTGLAFSYTLLTKKVYRVHNILIFNQMQDGDIFSQAELSETVTTLDKLNKMSDLEKDKIQILSMLGMREKDLKKISEIKATDIKGSSALWVDIDTVDRQTGVDLMEALPGFILLNPSIVNKLKMQKSLMTKNRDDLKAIIENPVTNIKLSRDTVVYLPSIDLYTLREKYNRIITILEKMESGQLVSLAWKTELPKIPFKPRKIQSILIGLIMGLFLGVIITFIMEWKESAIKLNNMILQDALKEFDITSHYGYGIDGDEHINNRDFEAVRGTFEGNKFVATLRTEIAVIEKKGTDLVSMLKNLQ